MDFMQKFFRSIALVPGVLHGTEAMLGAATGEQKKKVAVEVVEAAINVADAVSNKKIADAEMFSRGIGQVIDGVTMCLNASIWAK